METPRRLGKYLIRRELGRGAMGVVYEGFDPMIERAVAIKVLRLDEADPHLAAELRMRFRREAQAVGRLGHPSIVAVYEYGEDAGADATFIVMELVRGRDLKSLFDSGKRFTLAETGRLMAELLAALQHAHERGVVHRDIKPGNIILLDDGGVKVADFGIARLDTSELTQLGSVLGTVSHMSPEQLTGEAVDGRSDLYSCGVILYQLLTGARPFSGPPAALIHKVLHETPPPVSQRVPTLAPALDDVVHTAMAKQPAQRYADARAFATALRTALDAVPPHRFDADATVVSPPLADPDATLGSPSTAAATETVAPASRAPADVVLSKATAARESSATAARASAAMTSPPIGVDAYAAAAGPRTPPSRDRVGRIVALGVLGVAGVVVAGAVVFRMIGPGSEGAAIIAAPASAAPALASASAAAHASASTTTAMLTSPMPAAATREMPASATPPAGVAATASGAMAKVAGRPAPIATPPASAPRGIAPPAAPARIGAPTAFGAASTAGVREMSASAPTVVAAAPTPTYPQRAAPAPTTVPPQTVAPAPSTASPSSKESRAVTPLSGAAALGRSEARSASAPSARIASPPAASIASAPSVRIASAASARSASSGSARVAAEASAPARAASTASAARGDTECLDEARRGNARCQVVVGQMYRSGRGVARDPVEAARWYGKAAEQGSDAGQYELGLLHESGIGVPRDPVAALAWYRKAAAQGHARAQYRIGIAYENGTVGAANPVLAAEWYRKAADQNLAIAEYHLALLYLSGRGVFKDRAKGQALLQKAADAGEPNSMVYVAAMYDKGDGKPRDRDQATRLYRDALARPGINERNRETATRALAAAR